MDNKIEINIEELSDNQHGSTTSKVVSLIEGVSISDAESKLIYDAQDVNKIVNLSSKGLVSLEFGMEIDSHYNLERFLMLKRDSVINKHRYSIDLSGILPLIILQGVVEKISPMATNLFLAQEDMETMVELSKTIFRYDWNVDMRLESILGKTQLVDHYLTYVVNTCAAMVEESEVLQDVIEYLISEFNQIKRKLLVKLRSIEGVKVISIGYDNILIDSNIDNLLVFLKYRDLEFSMPVSELQPLIKEAI